MNTIADYRREYLPVEVIEPEWTPESDARKIMRFMKATGKLEGKTSHKVALLSNLNCIHYAGNNVWLCFGLDKNRFVKYEGKVYEKIPHTTTYNHDATPYTISKVGKEFACTCQGFAMRGHCLHVDALKIDLKKGSGRENE